MKIRMPETCYYCEKTREIKMTWFGSLSCFFLASIGAGFGLLLTIAFLKALS